MMSSAAWAAEQWQDVDLGDKRTNERAVLIGQRIAEKPDASLPAQMSSETELQAAYRFLNNRAVTMNALLEPSIRQTKQQARQEAVVLWIEDTTKLDHTPHRNSKSGMDTIGDEWIRSVAAQHPGSGATRALCFRFRSGAGVSAYKKRK